MAQAGDNNENTDNNNQSTNNVLLRQMLRPYDKNGDGNIEWVDFCEMARNKNFKDSERDQFWLELGGATIGEGRIPLQQIISQSPNPKQKTIRKYPKRESEEQTKFIREAFVHNNNSDEEPSMSRVSFTDEITAYSDPNKLGPRRNRGSYDEEKESKMHRPTTHGSASVNEAYDDADEEHELRRSQTEKSQLGIEPKQLLLDNPLRLFERYDMEENGKLDMKQFVQLISGIYSDNGKGFVTEIKKTFICIDNSHGGKGSFTYGENVHNLAEELRKSGGIPTDKYELLKLCKVAFVFVDVNITNNNEDFDIMNDPIAQYKTICSGYTKNLKSETKNTYTMTKMVISDLMSWVEEYAVTAIHQNTGLRKQNNGLQQENNGLKQQIPTLEQELSIKQTYQTEMKIQNVRLKKVNESLKNANEQIIAQYHALTSQHKITKEEFETCHSEHERLKSVIQQSTNNETSYKYLQEINESLQKQVKEMERVHRLQNETRHMDKPFVMPHIQLPHYTSASSHPGGLEIHSDTDDIKDKDECDLHSRPVSRDSSVRHIYGLVTPQTTDNEAMYFEHLSAGIEDIEYSQFSQTESRNEANEYSQKSVVIQPSTEKIEELFQKQKKEIIDAVTKGVVMTVGRVISTNNTDKNPSQELIGKYNQLLEGHKRLVEDMNKKNDLRDAQWNKVVRQLGAQIKLSKGKLQCKDSEVEMYKNAIARMKSEQKEMFEKVMASVKERERENKEVFNGLKSEINKVLLCVAFEEENMSNSRQFQLLAKQLQNIEKSLEKNENNDTPISNSNSQNSANNNGRQNQNNQNQKKNQNISNSSVSHSAVGIQNSDRKDEDGDDDYSQYTKPKKKKTENKKTQTEKNVDPKRDIRSLIGLDISQNMRLITQQIDTFVQSGKKSQNEFNERLDQSIKNMEQRMTQNLDELKKFLVLQNEKNENNRQSVSNLVCTQSKVCTDAIESAGDTIQSTQLISDTDNVQNFSDLKHDIYQINKQLMDVNESITSMNDTLAVSVKSIRIANETSNKKNGRNLHEIKELMDKNIANISELDENHKIAMQNVCEILKELSKQTSNIIHKELQSNQKSRNELDQSIKGYIGIVDKNMAKKMTQYLDNLNEKNRLKNEKNRKGIFDVLNAMKDKQMSGIIAMLQDVVKDMRLITQQNDTFTQSNQKSQNEFNERLDESIDKNMAKRMAQYLDKLAVTLQDICANITQEIAENRDVIKNISTSMNRDMNDENASVSSSDSRKDQNLCQKVNQKYTEMIQESEYKQTEIADTQECVGENENTSLGSEMEKLYSKIEELAVNTETLQQQIAENRDMLTNISASMHRDMNDENASVSSSGSQDLRLNQRLGKVYTEMNEQKLLSEVKTLTSKIGELAATIHSTDNKNDYGQLKDTMNEKLQALQAICASIKQEIAENREYITSNAEKLDESAITAMKAKVNEHSNEMKESEQNRLLALFESFEPEIQKLSSKIDALDSVINSEDNDNDYEKLQEIMSEKLETINETFGETLKEICEKLDDSAMKQESEQKQENEIEKMSSKIDGLSSVIHNRGSENDYDRLEEAMNEKLETLKEKIKLDINENGQKCGQLSDLIIENRGKMSEMEGNIKACVESLHNSWAEIAENTNQSIMSKLDEMNTRNNLDTQRQLFENEQNRESEYDSEMKQTQSFIAERETANENQNESENKSLALFELFEPEMNKISMILGQSLEPQIKSMSSKIDALAVSVNSIANDDSYDKLQKFNETSDEKLNKKYAKVKDLMQKNGRNLHEIKELMDKNIANISELDKNNKIAMQKVCDTILKELSKQTSNIIQKELQSIRLLIGLDTSQNMRQITQSHQKSRNEFNQSIKGYIEKVMKQYLDELNTLWVSQNEKNRKDIFDVLNRRMTEDIQCKDESKSNVANDDEKTTEPPRESETRIVHSIQDTERRIVRRIVDNIKVNKSSFSYWKTGVCNLFSVLIVNVALAAIFYAIHLGQQELMNE